MIENWVAAKFDTVETMNKNKIRLLPLLVTVAVFSGVPLHSLAESVKESKPDVKKTVGAKSSKVAGKEGKMTVYDFQAKTLDGSAIEMSQYKGDVLLIVNTASQCGFTSQYAGLEALSKKYSAKGLRVLGFPCNQFGGQEPGDSKEISNFCQKNFGVDFQMFDKIEVNGKNAHPLFKYLTTAAPGALGTEGIKWNFTKFLVDRNGNVLKRYAPNVKPEDISAEIEKLL